MVFLSWAGAGDRGRARAAEWSQRLNRAGFDVIDHPTWAGYDQILADIARSDAVIAAVSQLGGTWAATEQTSAAEGRDTFDGSRPSSSPRPTYFWFVDPTWVDPPRDRPVFPYLQGLLDRGRASRLPDDFDDAVSLAVELIGEGSGAA
jgi:hypothetical protein